MESGQVIILLHTLFVWMRTLMSWPSNVASICPTSKFKNSCKNTNLDPPLHGMRCVIVALMTFLVVATFNPERTLVKPSPKLGSPPPWLLASTYLSCSNGFIHFMTAHSIPYCFHCLLHAMIYLHTKYRKPGMHPRLECLCWNWKLQRLLCYCIDELTTHGSSWRNHKWIHIFHWSIQKIPQSFILILVSFILMNACTGSRHEWKEKPTYTIFLETQCTKTEWMFFKFVPKQCFSCIDIPIMDQLLIHILHSCGKRKYKQPYPIFLVIVEWLSLVCYVALYHHG